MHYINYRHADVKIKKLSNLYRDLYYGYANPKSEKLSFETFKRCAEIIKKFIKTDLRLNKQIQQSYLHDTYTFIYKIC